MAYTIITDSSANLPDSYIKQTGLRILSLEFIVDGVAYKGYLEGQATDNKQFYEMMREGKVVNTSLASLVDTETLFRSCFEEGYDVLYLGFDSAISGNFERVSSLTQQIRAEDYPQCKLRCIDSLAASLGEGMFVSQVVKKRDEGLGFDELADWAFANRLYVAHWFTVEDLKYLQRGGRLSAGKAIAGTLLNIKPVLHIDELGRLVPLENARGRKKSIKTLFDHYASDAREPRSELPVYISHGDCLEDAEQLAEMIRSEYGVTDILINYLDPVIGAHSGPGTLALFFLSEKPRQNS
jgi:DegV family protein with EDD domain